jgi:hypothetical protein
MNKIQKPQKNEFLPAATLTQAQIDEEYEQKKYFVNQVISKTAADSEQHFSEIKIDKIHNPSTKDRQRFKLLAVAVEINYHNLSILNKEQFVALKNIFF